MKGLKDIILLGDPRLYEACEPLTRSDLPHLPDWVQSMHEVMEAIRAEYNFGRAIAAPQLGIMKRLIYMNIDKPVIIINPEFTYLSDDKFEVWDDCMSLPNLFVKVLRHKEAVIRFYNENWEIQEWELSGDLSELLQHEYDHLNGVLCTMRAIDDKSYKWRRGTIKN